MKLFTIFFLLLMSATAMQAATFIVNSTADTNDSAPGNGVCGDAAGACSLRAAISEANALAGADTITLPAGTYTTTIPTTSDNANADGDFDITQDLTITGAGAGTTFVEAAPAPATASDRVFHIPTGGIVAVIENLTVRNGSLTGFSATSSFSRGGGIQNLGNLTLNNVIVSNNQTVVRAGGIYSTGTGNQITLNNSTVSGNSVVSADQNVFAGGMFVENGTATITNSSITGNFSTSTFINPDPAINGGFGFAAGYYGLNGTHTFTRSTSSNNVGTGAGDGGTQGTGLRFNSNAAGMTINIIESSVSSNSGNTTTGASNSGTGIAINAAAGFPITFNLTRSTVSGNLGSSDGAGLTGPGGGGGTINITNSTFSGNSTTDGFGGAITSAVAAGVSATVNISSSTIANNSAGAAGGGIAQLGTVINVQNTIIADNTATTGDPDVNGAYVSQGFNLIETVGAATGFPGANDIIGVDPQLQPLANNGGPTQTHALALTSPAIDTGNSTLTTDQRNAFRPVDLPNANGAGNASDIGAFEAQGATAAGVTVSGRVTARKGFGVARAIVSMTNQSGVTRTAKTDSNGNYKFEDVAAGETYVFSVSAPRYQFASQVVTISEDLDGLNFTSRR